MYKTFDREYDRPGNPEKPQDEVYPEPQEVELEEADEEWMEEEDEGSITHG